MKDGSISLLSILCSSVIWVKSHSKFLSRLQVVLQYRECRDSHNALRTPECQPSALVTASRYLLRKKLDTSRLPQPEVREHQSPVPPCQDDDQNNKFETKHGGLLEMGYFVICFKLQWYKTSSADLQVYLVNLKEDTVTRLKFHSEIERTDYSTFMRWVFSLCDPTLTESGDK